MYALCGHAYHPTICMRCMGMSITLPQVDYALSTNCTLRGASVDLIECDLRSADLSGSSFNDADLNGANLSGDNISDVIFSGIFGNYLFI